MEIEQRPQRKRGARVEVNYLPRLSDFPELSETHFSIKDRDTVQELEELVVSNQKEFQNDWGFSEKEASLEFLKKQKKLADDLEAGSERKKSEMKASDGVWDPLNQVRLYSIAKDYDDEAVLENAVRFLEELERRNQKDEKNRELEIEQVKEKLAKMSIRRGEAKKKEEITRKLKMLSFNEDE